MQTKISYILFFLSFFYSLTVLSQDIKPIRKPIPAIKKDTIPKKKAQIKNDSLSLRKKDSIIIASDSIIKPKEVIEGIITHDAEDYSIQNAKKNTLTLYNKAVVKYQDIEINAGIIIIDNNKETLTAKGIKDSLGYHQKPIFKQGREETEQDSLVYNLKSKKALIYGIKTTQSGVITYGTKTKRVNDSTIYMRKMRFTTSKNFDYYIATDKAKMVPGKKIIVGLSNLVIADVPLPVALPFAYLPLGGGGGRSVSHDEFNTLKRRSIYASINFFLYHPGLTRQMPDFRQIQLCIWSNPTKWTHFGAMSATVGVTLLYNFKNVFNQWIIFCDMIHRYHAVTLYLK